MRGDGEQPVEGVEGSGFPPRQQFVNSLVHALRNTGVTIIYQDEELRFVWGQNLPEQWHAVAKPGASDRDLFPGEEVDRVIAAKKAVLASGSSSSLSVALPGQDGQRWFDIWLDADKAGDDHIRGLVTTVVEITDQKRREQTLKVLLREVSHRSKNLLAIIQSIASQTGRYSGTIDTFLQRFRGRLQSLASSQDLVTSSNWRGADLHELVMGQVGRYAADPQASILFAGERPYLNPNAALHIGLALHELAVNSVSYGALSRPGGSVAVSARLNENAADGALALSWSERIPPVANKQLERRFGSVALERVVPSSLGGTANLHIDGDRLEYRLIVPAGSFEIE